MLAQALQKTRKKREFPDLAPVAEVKRRGAIDAHGIASNTSEPRCSHSGEQRKCRRCAVEEHRVAARPLRLMFDQLWTPR